MTSLAEDYGLKDSGRGNDAKFNTVKATDPDTLRILDARDRALGDSSLSRPVRAFVCFIIDRSLNPHFYDIKGVVCIADSKVGEKFGVTERTVYDWRHCPGIDRYLWFSKKGRPNMWPMMVYHLACLHPAPRFEKRTDADGTFAGGASDRHAPREDLAAAGREKRNAALAAQRAQKSLPLSGGIAVVADTKVPVAPRPTGSRPAIPLPKSSSLRRISAEARIIFRRLAEKNFGPEPKKISADSRKKLRPGAEENFGSEPKKISAASRNEHRQSAETDCRHLETQVAGNEVSKGREALPPRLAALPETNRKDVETWNKTIAADTYRSKLEKQRRQFQQQRASMRKSLTRDVLDAKIECLDIRIDGPLPPYEPAAPEPRLDKREKPKVSPSTLAALKEAAR